ncbi:FimV/HubP family polar landmark protein, partial [Propionivibrio sp.]
PVEKPVEKPVDAKPAEPATKPEEPKPQPKPAEKPKPAVAPPPKPEEPGFLDVLLDNPLALAGGGVLALLAGYFVVRRRQASKEEPQLDLTSTLSPQSSSLSLTANSVFRSTGGQSVDTSHTPAQTDFSQAGPGSIDTDEVDPVAEADVYMAYGRDVQAEEILVEAKSKDPKRHAIHLKLLEIYSNRKDIKQFENLATDLYSDTGGVGAEWEKAAAMGLKLDPSNPLFGSASAQAAQPPAQATFDADATVLVTPAAMKNTVTLPGELAQLAEAASAEAASAASESPAGADMTSLDFDLGLGGDKAPSATDADQAKMDETYRLPEPVADSGALDFDLASDQAAPADGAAGSDAAVVGLDFDLPEAPSTAAAVDDTVKEAADLDFDLGFESSPTDASATTSAGQSRADTVPEAPTANEIDFDINLTESTFLGRSMPEPSSFDMTSIDLDLKTPELAMQRTESAPAGVETTVNPDTADAEMASVLATTAVNPDFETQQFETVVNPQFAAEPDLLPEQDFSTEQLDTVVNPQFDQESSVGASQDFAKTQAETVVNPQFGVEADLAPEFDISPNEEVTTKLDLAKAYEEMGDLEGARELLQEVLKEGDAAQQEKAQSILSRISE